jgi:hypothetical protein
MAIAFVQGLGTQAIKSTAATITITTSKTITAGNTIFLGYASSTNTLGTTSATDNLGNVYTVVDQGIDIANTTLSVLLTAPITVGGALTSISITSTGGSAQAAIAGEFSGVGSRVAHSNLTNGGSTNCNAYPGVSATTTTTQVPGNLWVGMIGWKSTAGTFTTPVPSTAGVAASNVPNPVGTFSGASGSNRSLAVIYFVCNAATSNMLNGQISSSVPWASVGAEYAPSGGGGSPGPSVAQESGAFLLFT